jgi:hypothetical protein
MRTWLVTTIFLLATFAGAQTLTPVTTPSPCIMDASNVPMLTGMFYIQAFNPQTNKPQPFTFASGGIATTDVVTRSISNGQLVTPLSVADASGTSPTNIRYRITIQNTSTQKFTIYNNVDIEGSAPFNLCTQNLGMFAVPLPSFIPIAGPVGPPGNSNPDSGVGTVAPSNGTDVGTLVNTAFATHTHVFVPYVPGVTYNYSVTMQLPVSANDYLQIDPQVTLHYTGSDTGIEVLTGADHFHISGGKLTGTASARSGIRMDGAEQGGLIENMNITGFTAGDGMISRGANVVTIFNDTAQSNMNGLNLEGRPAFASNAFTVIGGNYNNNSGWGIIDGLSNIYPTSATYGGGGLNYGAAGTQSPNYNNHFIGVNVESNGIGGIAFGLTRADSVEFAYFEGAELPMKIGQSSPTTVTANQALYGVPGTNGGQSGGTAIHDNFFNTTNHDQIQLDAVNNYSIHDNAADNTFATCFINVTSGSWGPGFTQTTEPTATNNYCTAGTPQMSNAALVEMHVTAAQGLVFNELAIGDKLFFNGDGPFTASQSSFLTMTTTGPPQGSGAGRGACTPAWAFGTVWVETDNGAWWKCTIDSEAPGGGWQSNAADGFGTWVKMQIASTL